MHGQPWMNSRTAVSVACPCLLQKFAVGEDRAAALRRIGRSAVDAGLSVIRFCWCSSPAELEKHHLRLRHSPPPFEHYNVDLGYPLVDGQVEAFISAFGDKERMP